MNNHPSTGAAATPPRFSFFAHRLPVMIARWLIIAALVAFWYCIITICVRADESVGDHVLEQVQTCHIEI
jgi:hypothetical protein